MIDIISLILRDAFWSGLAALGFAILFNVPRRALPGCVLCGAAGHASRALVMQWGVSIELGTLIGAVVVGMMSSLLASHYRVPMMIFSVSGSIPMVPGVFAYRAMLGIITAATAEAPDMNLVIAEIVVNAIKTALILGSIGAGIVAPTLLFHRPRPVV